MFKRIVPSLYLDITDILMHGMCVCTSSVLISLTFVNDLAEVMEVHYVI